MLGLLCDKMFFLAEKRTLELDTNRFKGISEWRD